MLYAVVAQGFYFSGLLQIDYINYINIMLICKLCKKYTKELIMNTPPLSKQQIISPSLKYILEIQLARRFQLHLLPTDFINLIIE